MVNLGLLKKVEMVKKLNQQVHWDCGELKSSVAPEFRFGFVSEPIDSEIFLGITNFATKSKLGFPINDLELDKDWDFPEHLLNEYRDKLVVLFPKFSLKGNKIVSSRLDAVSIKKTKKGIVIKGLFKGLKA